MSNLAQLLPQESPTVAAIFAHYKKVGDSEQPRGYLGASIIGHPCERYLWYTFRYCCRPTFDGRMYRLFATGDLEEVRFVADLREIGCTVHEVDPATGKQFEVSALGGHFSGHMDGCAVGIPGAEKTWVVLEFKTHNAKSFAKLKKEGVKVAKPQHYAQMQAYMHLTGMTRALYLACNKDTDDLYAERVHFDPSFASGLIDKAQRIVTSTTPPERAFTRPDYFECQWCDAKRICWGDPAGPALPVPAINCRQCCHATPMMDGLARWQCEKHNRSLSPEDQARVCDDHLTLPGLLPFAEPTNYGQEEGRDYICFECENHRVWYHGGGAGAFSSKELMAIPASQLSNPIINVAKQVFDATVTAHCPDDILSRYPESDSRITWRGAAGLLKTEWMGRYGEDITKLEPVARGGGFDYEAVEYSGGRVVILWTALKQIGAVNCEIREGIK